LADGLRVTRGVAVRARRWRPGLDGLARETGVRQQVLPRWLDEECSRPIVAIGDRKTALIVEARDGRSNDRGTVRRRQRSPLRTEV